MQAIQTSQTDQAIVVNQGYSNHSDYSDYPDYPDILADRVELGAQTCEADDAIQSAATDVSQQGAASDQRMTIIAELNMRIHELDAMAAAAEQTVAALFYRWGSAKYRSYSGQLEAAEHPVTQGDVIFQMRKLSDALQLAELCNADQPGLRGLAEIKDATSCHELSGEAQNQLRAELSSFLVRHVHQIVQRTEESITQLECSRLSQVAPDEIREIIRWHANRVLDLLELLPGCDVARTTDEIDLVLSVIQQSTIEKLNALASQESATNHRQGHDPSIDLAA